MRNGIFHSEWYYGALLHNRHNNILDQKRIHRKNKAEKKNENICSIIAKTVDSLP